MREPKRLLSAVLWLTLFVITAPFIYSASGALYVALFSYTHHFRLVLEIEDHGKIRTGSSVIAASVLPAPTWLPKGLQSASTHTHGEAVVVRLSTGRLVVATLGHGPAEGSDLLYSLAARAHGRNDELDWFKYTRHWWRPVELTRDLIPLIVTFDDIDDPYSIRAVPPDVFPETFGPEIRFHRMWLRITSDRVTRRIEDHIPFLATRREELARLGGPPFVTPNLELFIRGK